MAGTLFLLGGFRALHRVGVVQRFVYPTVRFLSDHLLTGVVFHYLVYGALILPQWSWVGGGLGPRGRVSAILLASLLNVILLVGGLKLVVGGWAFLRKATAARIGEINIQKLAAACLAWLVALHVARVFGVLSDLNLRWLAYAAMLVLALAYGDSRRGRRRKRDAEPARGQGLSPG